MDEARLCSVCIGTRSGANCRAIGSIERDSPMACQWRCAVLASPLSHLLDGDKHENGARFAETMANSVSIFVFIILCDAMLRLPNWRDQTTTDAQSTLHRLLFEPRSSTQIKQPPSDNRSNDPPAGENVWRPEKKMPDKANVETSEPQWRKWTTKNGKKNDPPNERRWRKT